MNSSIDFFFEKLIFVEKLTMAKYRISGIWKNSNNVITHYAFHEIQTSSTTRAIKKTKTDAIAILQTIGNSATTWIWDYQIANWKVGQNVEVVNNANGKYLRSDPNNNLTDNLEHLIDYDWIAL